MTHFNIGSGVESKSSFENGKYFRNKIAKEISKKINNNLIDKFSFIEVFEISFGSILFLTLLK